jgi:hypothetical protein
MTGSGSIRLSKDGQLKGVLKIKNGSDSLFTAERTIEPDKYIPDPPSYKDKWNRKRW